MKKPEQLIETASRGKRLAALACFLVCLFLSLSASRAEERKAYHWIGRISVHRQAEGAPSLTGTFDLLWTLEVRWKEAQRVNVVDSGGRLVGQLVRLEDDGSRWSGRETGYHVTQGGGAITERWYSGSGQGGGKTISVGWIYFSLSDDDPLKGSLPSGTYCFGSGSGASVAFGTSVRTVTTTRDRVDEVTNNFSGAAMLDYFVGRLFLGHGVLSPGTPSGQITGAHAALMNRIQQALAQAKARQAGQVGSGNLQGCGLDGPMSAADLRSRLPGQAMPGHDARTRVISGDRMTGQYDNFVEMGLSQNVTRKLRWQVSWDVERVLDVTAIIKQVRQDWRPTCQGDGDTVDVEARIEEPEGVRGKFRFTLYDVSAEPGYALNAGQGTGPDLEIPAGQEGFTEPRSEGDSWWVETTDTVAAAKLRVRSLDYGAWGRIKAEVYVDGRKHQCLSDDGKDNVTIPLDQDEDRIADKWESDHQVSELGTRDDRDGEPEDVGDPEEPGDGFSNYEEYRGFLIKGRWSDTDPRKKDLFVCDELGFGLGFFHDLGLAAHLIDREEFDGQRYVNFNRGRETTLQSQDGQKGLLIIKADLEGARYGFAGQVGCPNVVDEIKIDLDLFWLSYLHRDKGYIPPGATEELTSNPPPGKMEEASADFALRLKALIAHELGHGVNIMHHAFSDPCPQPLSYYDQFEDWRRICEPGVTAVTGGKWSGDLGCVMTFLEYPFKYYGHDDWYYDYPADKIEVPTHFCDSKAGTGVNSASYRPEQGDERPYPVAGEATWGDCRRMVDLKGRHENGDVPGL